MQKATFDPGLTQNYTGVLKRAINKNGQFNVHRAGSTWRDVHPYLLLINASWPVFSVAVMIMFIAANIGFAFIYMLVGIDNLKGGEAPSQFGQFLNAFFFSAHTITTVGYGNIYPVGVAANTVAVLESLIGLLSFAVVTGLMFGRFAKPTARIGFSKEMVVAPYMGATSLQFRVVNRRSNNLIDLSAQLVLMTVEPVEGRLQRKFQPLPLEREAITFLPLMWTIVHPIGEGSPFFGKSAEDFERLQGEILVSMRAFDETFGQTVHARISYRYDEIHWGAKFLPGFEIDQDGDMRLEVNRVGLIEPVDLPSPELS